jgi:hypothetical protein
MGMHELKNVEIDENIEKNYYLSQRNLFPIVNLLRVITLEIIHRD